MFNEVITGFYLTYETTPKDFKTDHPTFDSFYEKVKDSGVRNARFTFGLVNSVFADEWFAKKAYEVYTDLSKER